MKEKLATRVAYSPGDFAKLFGKSQTWGYRQIYAGKVTAITEHGRFLIPAKEVERVLESAGIYNGQEKPKARQARVKKLTGEQKGIWQRFVELRRQGASTSKVAARLPKRVTNSSEANDVRSRLTKTWQQR